MMRPILLADIDLAARVLLALPPGGRAMAMDSLLHRAARADAYRRATGRLLPGEGDGSLISVALGQPRADPAPVGRDYRVCLGIVLDRIALHELTHHGL
jgi:hypothetical protein